MTSGITTTAGISRGSGVTLWSGETQSGGMTDKGIGQPLPPNSANAFDYLASPSYCFKDAAKTLPCGDGDLVYTWKERLGSGFDATQSVAANRPTLRKTIDGKWQVHFNGFNSFMNLPSGLTFASDSVTIWCNYNNIDVFGLTFPVSLHGSANTYMIDKYMNSAAVQAGPTYPVSHPNAGVSGTNIDGPAGITYAVAPGVNGVLCASFGSTASILQYNGMSPAVAASPIATSATAGGTIGANSSSMDYIDNVMISEVLLYNYAQGNADMATVNNYFNGVKAGNWVFPTNIPMIVGDGNSIIEGFGIAYAQPINLSLLMQMEGLITNGAMVANLGIGGITTPQMTAIDAEVSPNFWGSPIATLGRVANFWNASRSKNILIGLELTNDIYNGGAGGVSGATAYADYKTYFTARRAEMPSGGTIIAGDMIASPGIITGAMITAKNIVNADLSADFPIATAYPNVFAASGGVTSYGVNYLIKFSQLPMNYQGDNTHPIQSSYQMMGQIAAGAVAAGGVGVAFPTPAVVAHGQGLAAGGANGTTPALNMTGTNAIYAAVSSLQANSASLPVDSLGNVYVSCGGPYATTAHEWCQLFVCNNPLVSSSMTFGFGAGAANFASIMVVGMSGMGYNGVDQQTGNNAAGTGTTLQTGSVTPSTNGQVIIAAIASESGSFTIDSGMTILEQNTFAPGNDFGMALAWKLQSTAVPINPTWTFTSCTGPAAAIASFKPMGVA